MSENRIEKRMARRYRVLKGASIAFEGNSVACTVRNMSSSGAALDVEGSIPLPRSFMLLIETDQFIRRAHAVWNSNNRFGIAFD